MSPQEDIMPARSTANAPLPVRRSLRDIGLNRTQIQQAALYGR